MTSALSITTSVNPPRAAFVDYPLGHTTGRIHDLDGQKAIVRAGLEVTASATEPGQVVDLGLEWSDDQSWRIDAMNWRPDRKAPKEGDPPTNDSRVERHAVPQYQSDQDRDAAAAVSDDEQCLVCIGIDL